MVKSKTSTEVKQRYLDRAYMQLGVRIPKELGERFKAKCKSEGIPQRQIIIEAVREVSKGLTLETYILLAVCTTD